MKVFVVSFAPYEEQASVGGFDWYYTKEMALNAFDKEVKINSSTHTIRLVEFESHSSYKDIITQEIDNNIDEVENYLPAIKEHLPLSLAL